MTGPRNGQKVPVTRLASRQTMRARGRSPLTYCSDVLGEMWVFKYCDEQVRVKASEEERDDEFNLALERLFTALRLVDLDAEDDLATVRERLAVLRKEALPEVATRAKHVAEPLPLRKTIPNRRKRTPVT